MVGDCHAERRFQLAWASGAPFADIPLAQLAYPDLQVVVHRECPRPAGGSPVQFDYTAIAADRFDPFAQHPGRWVQSVVPVSTLQDHSTTMYVQNGGVRCTTVQVRYHRYGDWSDASSYNVVALAPGETFPWRAVDCIVSDWTGAVVFESTEPLAILAETLSPQSGLSAVGRNRSNPYDITGDGRVDEADLTALDQALGTSAGDSGWNWFADLDADGVVTLIDRRIVEDNLDAGAVPPPSPTAAPTNGTATPTLSSTSTATATPTATATRTSTATSTAATATGTATRASEPGIYLPYCEASR
jgi:hypothetical protein